MGDFLKGLRGAAGLLTRIPVRAQVQKSSEMAAAVAWFPVVGAGVGAAIAGVYAGFQTFLPSFVAATLAVAAGAVITGAFHEDGLADLADASAGGTTHQDRLRILKDPTLGTFGVLAVVTGFALRAGVIASLDAWTALRFLTAAHSISRGASIVLMVRSRSFPNSGLGASYGEELTRRQIATGVGVALAIGVLCIGVWAVPAGGLALLGAWSIGLWSHRKIGKITGDGLGAAQQVAELLILLLAAAAPAAYG